VLFLAFAFVSFLWSDFPFVTVKRWVRDLGMYLVILVVVTDPRPLPAISSVVRRWLYLLLGLSLLLIKYYPEMGISFDVWTGVPMYVGATLGKNSLGLAYLVGGLFFFWDTLGRWPERKSPEGKRLLVANITFLAITYKLLMIDDSATSKACLLMGCVTMIIIRSNWGRTNPRTVSVGVFIALVIVGVLQYVFDVSTMVAGLLGRDPTLTGRTNIWDAVLKAQPNPLLGAGYQSFWMGDRMVAVWKSLEGGAGTMEAHNGYLEIYLNLGLVGVVLLILFMISSYRRVSRQLTVSPHVASFAIPLWLVTVVYNYAEAAFGASILWILLLFFVTAVSRSDEVLCGGTVFAVKRKGPLILHSPGQPVDSRI